MDGFVILYPDRRRVSAERLIAWARDDVANDLCALPEYSRPECVQSVQDAINVLSDTGTVTIGN